ncbi:hypothetical protein [Sulfitobacter sp. MF3-043]|uniref:hypothetical protein n=1 Tax=Sulfitobacter sediminivivens TaxID=3252902 RepID=UPI0036D7A92F
MNATWRDEQLYTSRRKVGILHLDKEGIVNLGKFIAMEFPGEDVLVITGLESQSAKLLSLFEKSTESFGSTDFVRIVANRREGDGFLRQLEIEIGPSTNFVQAQSFDENWAIGAAERAKRQLMPYELPRFFHFDYLGSIINGLIFTSLIAFAPSIQNTPDRFFYVFSLVIIMVFVKLSFDKFVPNAFILLDEKRVSKVTRIVNRYMSVILGILGLAIASFITVKFEETIGRAVDFLTAIFS